MRNVGWAGAAEEPVRSEVLSDKDLFRKIGVRILPILMLAYIIGYVDRVGISIAKLSMMKDLNLSEIVYGLGSGIFFVGYIIFEVPSNLILHRVGARVWLARIMITWGVILMLMMLVRSSTSFYFLRFLLGAAEAGFVPGAVYYLTRWYPEARRGQVYGLLITGSAIGGVVVGPISGWIMSAMENVAGLRDWQWLFVFEGAPAVILGVLLFCVLAESPERAAWLTSQERDRLDALVAPSTTVAVSPGVTSVRPHLVRLLFLGLAMAAVNLGIYAGVFWLPTMLKAGGAGDIRTIGWLSSLPYLGAISVMLGLGASSDKLGERRIHVALTMLLGAVATFVSALLPDRAIVSCGCIIVSTALFIGVTPLIWTVLSQSVSGKAAAVSFAILNIFGAVGGFSGPYLMGLAQQFTSSTAAALFFASALAVLGAVLVLVVASRPAMSDAA